MKTLILTTALVVLSALSFAQFPQKNAPDSCCYVADDLRVVILQNNDSTVTLQMAKNSGDLVKIRIKEDGSKLIYNRRVKNFAAANLVYDLQQFPEGDYVFEIVKDKEVVYSKTVTRTNSSKNLVAKN